MPLRTHGLTHINLSVRDPDRRGEFAPGMPFAYVRDPDGYEIEIWFE